MQKKTFQLKQWKWGGKYLLQREINENFSFYCVSISDVIIVDINALVSGSVQLLHFSNQSVEWNVGGKSWRN